MLPTNLPRRPRSAPRGGQGRRDRGGRARRYRGDRRARLLRRHRREGPKTDGEGTQLGAGVYAHPEDGRRQLRQHL